MDQAQTSGSTASTCRLGRRMRRNACWSSSVPRAKGKKELVGLIDGVRGVRTILRRRRCWPIHPADHCETPV